MQFPLPDNAVLYFARRVHGPLAAANEGVLVGKELVEHRQHCLAFYRISVGRDDGGKLQRIVRHSRYWSICQLLEISDEGLHCRVVQLEAWHQVIELSSIRIDAVANGTGQCFIRIRTAVWPVTFDVRHRHVLDVPESGAEQVPADDGRNNVAAFLSTEAATAVT